MPPRTEHERRFSTYSGQIILIAYHISGQSLRYWLFDSVSTGQKTYRLSILVGIFVLGKHLSSDCRRDNDCSRNELQLEMNDNIHIELSITGYCDNRDTIQRVVNLKKLLLSHSYHYLSPLCSRCEVSYMEIGRFVGWTGASLGSKNNFF
jgi:membrane protein required for beta-lactamase induction